MPEITITLPGLRHVGSGATEQDAAMLKEMRQQEKVRLWSAEGTDEECEDSWRQFLLAGTPDWEIFTS